MQQRRAGGLGRPRAVYTTRRYSAPNHHAVCTGTRAIPVAVSACHKPQLARSQNLWEETFLRLTVDRLRAAGVSAVWLCDRGFHRLGLKLRWTQFTKPEFVERMYLLVGMALLLWTAVGRRRGGRAGREAYE